MNDEHDLFQGNETNREKEAQLLLLLTLMFCANMKDSEELQGDEQCSPNHTET